jgi:hypothetical protein
MRPSNGMRTVAKPLIPSGTVQLMVGRCRLTAMKPKLKPPGTKHLRL